MSAANQDVLVQGKHLGEEFLVWLWWRCLTQGGTSGVDGDTSALLIDQAIALGAEHGDVKELSLKKGNPAESAEAFQALARGMRPVKASMRLLDGDMEWVFTLVAATMEIQGAKLPKVQCKDIDGAALDRLFHLEALEGQIQARFEAFIRERMDDPEAFAEVLRGWISETAESLAENAA